MAAKCREIDNRNKLFGVMKYQIRVNFPAFFDAREWCWQHWGPGIEYEYYLQHMYLVADSPKLWCWDSSKYQGASRSSGLIYLPNDHMKTLFMLTWA